MAVGSSSRTSPRAASSTSSPATSVRKETISSWWARKSDGRSGCITAPAAFALKRSDATEWVLLEQRARLGRMTLRGTYDIFAVRFAKPSEL